MQGITALELNFLIFRYLQESGFTHSAFTFGCEAGLSNCPIDGNMVPPGSLVKCIQKGVQYSEMEANLNISKTVLDGDFSFIRPLDIITKDVNELRQMITDRMKNQQKDVVKANNRQQQPRARKVSERADSDDDEEYEKYRQLGQKYDRKKKDTRKYHEKRRDRISTADDELNPSEDQTDTEMFAAHEDSAVTKNKQIEIFGGTQPITKISTPYACGVPGVDVMILEGHTREVCTCAWTPAGSLLASGSADSTARIWNVAERTNGGKSGYGNPYIVLEHAKGTPSDRYKVVTSVNWNGDGSLLATGSLDGLARIWTSDGELKSTLRKHKDIIYSIKWNRKGDYILTGSLDTTAIVWDVKTNDLKQQFDLHSGNVLDTDWRNNESFAASTDTTIHVCMIGTNSPIKTFYGHQSEVNSIKWDPTGSLLASSSDDTTLKIWSLKQDNYIHNFREHKKGVFTSRWSPTGQSTSNPNKQLVLASASFDSTVKTWDVEQGKLLCNFSGHRDAVYSIAFSPDGEYLASGSKDGSLHIWSLKTGKIVKSYGGEGVIYEVCWNEEGDKVAACTNRNTVFVLDFRM